MSFPQHAEKQRLPPLFTASDFHRYVARHSGRPFPRVPPGIVLVFGQRWTRYLRQRFRGAPDRRTEVYRASSSVGVVGLQGPGAPYTAIVVEELIPLGARRFVIVGLAGSLRSDLPIGSFVVCSRAMRDEGTSHHYQRPSPYAPVSRRLAAAIKAELRRESIPFFEGPSWTTDAPYRETAAEVRRYRRDGILTVEMEAAAMFTVARRRGAEAAALFVISDLLDERGWEPQFHETREPLHRGLEIAIRACGR